MGPDRQVVRRLPARGAVLVTYSRAIDGSATRTATAGGTPNTSQILSARKLADGGLEITEDDSEHIMTYVLSKDVSGKYRSLSTRLADGRTIVRDGKYVNDGSATPPIERCR